MNTIYLIIHPKYGVEVRNQLTEEDRISFELDNHLIYCMSNVEAEKVSHSLIEKVMENKWKLIEEQLNG